RAGIDHVALAPGPGALRVGGDVERLVDGVLLQDLLEVELVAAGIESGPGDDAVDDTGRIAEVMGYAGLGRGHGARDVGEARPAFLARRVANGADVVAQSIGTVRGSAVGAIVPDEQTLVSVPGRIAQPDRGSQRAGQRVFVEGLLVVLRPDRGVH